MKILTTFGWEGRDFIIIASSWKSFINCSVDFDELILNEIFLIAILVPLYSPFNTSPNAPKIELI